MPADAHEWGPDWLIWCSCRDDATVIRALLRPATPLVPASTPSSSFGSGVPLGGAIIIESVTAGSHSDVAFRPAAPYA